MTHSCLLFTEFSSACNWKQASQSPVLPRSTEHIFCDPSYSFFVVVVVVVVVVVIFTEVEKEERLVPVFEAMNLRNLHYHTALQAVH